MHEAQYLDFPAKQGLDREEEISEAGQDFDVILAKVYSTLASIKNQGTPEIEKHKDAITEILTLCASFFSETDATGALLISGKDREELMTAENIFNSFSKELSLAKNEKLQKLIEAITPELQLPLSPAAIEQVKRNATVRKEFLEQYDTYSSNDIYRISGSTAANKAALASGWRSKGKIFAVNHKSNLYFPAFQFDMDTRPKKIIADVITIFGAENTGWQLALWFVSPNAVLGGKKPIDLIDSDPKALMSAVKEEVDPTLC